MAKDHQFVPKVVISKSQGGIFKQNFVYMFLITSWDSWIIFIKKQVREELKFWSRDKNEDLCVYLEQTNQKNDSFYVESRIS